MAGSTGFLRRVARWAHVAARPADDSADAGAASQQGAPAGDPEWTRNAPLPPGALIGGYRIDRVIGHGAVGTLYAALDPITDAPLAIKTFPLTNGEETDDAADRVRFLREAQAASRLDHPDIVTVFGAGEERGLGFIVMELLAGSDLSRYARPARLLPEPVVLRIVARVADALAYAHGRGVVHRDVKPANVMVDLPSHQVKLTDFGVARLADAGRTRTGFTLGTPVFMSPEQLAGAQVDGRSDLYSLGVMLFQLLTGHLPYEGSSMGELLRGIAGGSPRDLRELRPDLPTTLAELVALTLEKRPQTRYADGRQLADDLRLIESRWGAAQSVTGGAPPGP